MLTSDLNRNLISSYQANIQQHKVAVMHFKLPKLFTFEKLNRVAPLCSYNRRVNRYSSDQAWGDTTGLTSFHLQIAILAHILYDINLFAYCMHILSHAGRLQDTKITQHNISTYKEQHFSKRQEQQSPRRRL